MKKILSKQEKKAVPYIIIGALLLISALFFCSLFKFVGAILIIVASILIFIGIYKLLTSSKIKEVIDFEKLREIAEKT